MEKAVRFRYRTRPDFVFVLSFLVLMAKQVPFPSPYIIYEGGASGSSVLVRSDKHTIFGVSLLYALCCLLYVVFYLFLLLAKQLTVLSRYIHYQVYTDEATCSFLLFGTKTHRFCFLCSSFFFLNTFSCFSLRWLKQATFFSGLSPVAAVDVHRSLDRACQNLVVATELHALYLLTPLDGLEPDWGRFREEYTAWREEDPARIVGKAVSLGMQENGALHFRG